MVPHALVTSADVGLSTARMAAAGLALPDVRVTAESVGASKPDPEGFLKGAAELGVAPEDCVVFEDSGAGISAGRAAGMRVVGVGPRAGVHRPDAVVRDLTQVRVEGVGWGDSAARGVRVGCRCGCGEGFFAPSAPTRPVSLGAAAPRPPLSA